MVANVAFEKVALGEVLGSVLNDGRGLQSDAQTIGSSPPPHQSLRSLCSSPAHAARGPQPHCISCPLMSDKPNSSLSYHYKAASSLLCLDSLSPKYETFGLPTLPKLLTSSKLLQNPPFPTLIGRFCSPHHQPSWADLDMSPPCKLLRDTALPWGESPCGTVLSPVGTPGEASGKWGRSGRSREGSGCLSSPRRHLGGLCPWWWPST